MYPTTAPEIAIPELDGKTAKMYRFANLVIIFVMLNLLFHDHLMMHVK